MNTLVTKCRHPGIVILIWSLPLLQLLKRIDCDADMTCFTRMVSGDIFFFSGSVLYDHEVCVVYRIYSTLRR